MAAAGAAVNNTNKKVIFENCAPLTDCTNEINNTKIDDAEKIDEVMHMYNLIEYGDAYSKASGSWWQYYRDEPTIGDNGNIIDFPANNNNSNSFRFKQEITRQTLNSGTKDVAMIVSSNYLSNFWRTLKMHLINCEISFQ